MDLIMNGIHQDDNLSRSSSGGPICSEKSRMLDITRDKPIKVAVRVAVPVRDHPKFNFVGKLLGPKGNSMKRLQEETMCKMAVLGRGSMKDRKKEEDLRLSGDPRYTHLSEDLHVEISTFAAPAEAHARIAYALAEVRRFLVPDYHDDIRQEQMWEMQAISSSQCQPNQDTSTSSTMQKNCTIASDCAGGSNDDTTSMIIGVDDDLLTRSASSSVSSVNLIGNTGCHHMGSDSNLNTNHHHHHKQLQQHHHHHHHTANGGGGGGGCEHQYIIANGGGGQNIEMDLSVGGGGVGNVITTGQNLLGNNRNGGVIISPGVGTPDLSASLKTHNALPPSAPLLHNTITSIPYGVNINSVLLETADSLLHPGLREARAINIAGGNYPLRKRHLLGVPRSSNMTSNKRTVMSFLARAKNAQALHGPRINNNNNGPGSIGIAVQQTVRSNGVVTVDPVTQNDKILEVA